MKRSRTVEWDDPAAIGARAMTLSGLEFVRSAMDDTALRAPIAAWLGMSPEIVEPGRVVMRLEPDEHLCNPFGTVHGGVLSTLLDAAMGAAVQSTLPEGNGVATLEMSVRFLRPVTNALGVVRAEGRILHAGKRTVFTEGHVTDPAGVRCASAMATCVIIGGRRA